MTHFQIPKYTEQTIPQVENTFKFFVLVGLIILSFFMVQAGVEQIEQFFFNRSSLMAFVGKWGLVIGLGFWNGILIMGLASLGHEGNHRVLLKNPFLNDLLGGICWGFFLVPYYAFREFHFNHHSATHQVGVDPEELMNSYAAWFSLTIGPLLGLYITTKIMLRNLLVGQSKKQRLQGIKDVGFLTLILIFYFYIVPQWGLSLWYTVIPTILIMPYVFAIRNVGEHYAIPAQEIKRGSLTETPKIDSWIILTNPVLTWLWSHVNYHQIHHLYPQLSHHYLPQIFAANKDHYPYAVIKGYIPLLLHASHKPYYGQTEDLRPFLTTQSSF